jgi:hypothetical protein
MKRYAISSTYFDTLEKAREKLEEYDDRLDKDALIFESSTYYKPIKKIILMKAKRIK